MYQMHVLLIITVVVNALVLVNGGSATQDNHESVALSCNISASEKLGSEFVAAAALTTSSDRMNPEEEKLLSPFIYVIVPRKTASCFILWEYLKV